MSPSHHNLADKRDAPPPPPPATVTALTPTETTAGGHKKKATTCRRIVQFMIPQDLPMLTEQAVDPDFFKASHTVLRELSCRGDGDFGGGVGRPERS